MRPTTQTGISILELMLVLALVALTANLAMPSMQEFIASNRAQAIKYQLEQALWHARSAAVTQREPVQLCASLDMQNCHTDWSKGWIIRKLGDQNLLTGNQLDTPSMLLKWDGFQKNIVFHPSGISLTTNGRFYLCRDKKVEWQLVLNRQGRLRTSSQSENRQQDSKC